MDIRAVDAHDDQAFHAFFVALSDGELHERAGMPMWSEPECAVVFRHQDISETWTAYGAYEGDRLVGAGFTLIGKLDNLDKAFIAVAVAPENTRQGIGGALVEALVDLCRDQGRTTILLAANIPFEQREGHGYRRFAERHGFALANVEVRRLLELPVPAATLDDWAAEAAPHHPDYQLETFDGPLPEAMLESYCELLNQLALDAPTGDIDFEEEAMTPDALRDREKKFEEQGRTIYCTVATGANGEAVAHSAICVPAGDPGNLYQWATLVHRNHRGHRLGLAVKAANLRAVQAGHPDRTRLLTTNSETNAPMVAINEKMGFAPVELAVEFQRKLATS